MVLVARGAHLAAIRERGLLVRFPGGEETLRIPTATTPAEAGIRDGDVVFLATKTQDSLPALDALRAATGAVQPGVVCAQNGVENERLALRLFRNVYAMYPDLPAEHLEPGVVEIKHAVPHGVLDLGRYPAGTDAQAERIAADLERAGFASRVLPDVMRWKNGKVVTALGNAVKAVCGQGPEYPAILARMRAEGTAVFAAAGIDLASDAEQGERRHVIPGHSGPANLPGSGWQSIVRGTGSIETDYINGEVVRLGREHGIPTPVNEVIQRIANQWACERRPPASMPLAELAAEIAKAV